MPYNITNITNSNSLYEIVYHTNELTSGILFLLMLLMVFVVFLVVFYKQDFKKVLVADGFLVTIVASLAWTLGFIGFHVVIYPIIILGAALIIYMFT